MKKQEYQINTAPLIVIHKQITCSELKAHGTWIGDLIGPFIMNPFFMGIMGYAFSMLVLNILAAILVAYLQVNQ